MINICNLSAQQYREVRGIWEGFQNRIVNTYREKVLARAEHVNASEKKIFNLDVRTAEKALRDAGFSKKASRTILAKGYSAWRCDAAEEEAFQDSEARCDATSEELKDRVVELLEKCRVLTTN